MTEREERSLHCGRDDGLRGNTRRKAKKAVLITQNGFFDFNSGDKLRSHIVARAVSWARRSLTSMFGIGTGVSLAV
jgi:hypothetical protein